LASSDGGEGLRRVTISGIVAAERRGSKWFCAAERGLEGGGGGDDGFAFWSEEEREVLEFGNGLCVKHFSLQKGSCSFTFTLPDQPAPLRPEWDGDAVHYHYNVKIL
jgi:hypothetical protein